MVGFLSLSAKVHGLYFFLRSQGALMLFYTARIALLKGNFTFVSY